ncbi:MAG: hypothetical protein NXY59_03760 [Aigarchaeota archaeon]|nr:hypothetical protein [Candidatus Pelearchaeum maunauluense]
MPRVSRRLYLLGTLMRVNGDKALVAAKNIPRLSDKVVDAKAREIGYVSNVFGPVKSPFVIVRLTRSVSLREGVEVYGMR